MSGNVRHVSVRIQRSAGEVYDYASDPENLPKWAGGLGSSIEFVDGRWLADSPMGQVGVAFAPRNEFGVLDHTVSLPTGDSVLNPMRVIPDGDDGVDALVVFTLRQQPTQSDDEFAGDADTVTSDLATLKGILESG